MGKQNKSFVRSANFQGLLVLSLVTTIGAFVLMNNEKPPQYIVRPVQVQPTQSVAPEWRAALENQILNPATAEPTQEIPTVEYVAPPTVSYEIPSTVQVFDVQDVEASPFPSSTPYPTLEVPATPIEYRGATPVPSPEGIQQDFSDSTAIAQYAPPLEQIPLSLQPNDHFYMSRPVDASANNESLFYYPYGGVGQVFRVHHGLDIPNPIGERVLAAASGTVVWAASTAQDIKEGSLEIYVAYGNVVVIEHDFNIGGKPVYSLYAHMSAILVEKGQRVDIGQVIGLVGETGFVTGPHVHFEVRVGVNSYWETRNPLLWMAPYINHGVVAGRVVDGNGRFIDNAIIQINRGGRRIDSTTTYIQPKQPGVARWHIVPDDNWQENFALGDVPEGEYQIVALVDNQRYTQTLTVRASMVNFVEFVVGPSAPATPIPLDSGEGTEGS
ncbi:MAG: M23 family metallopeptidase [Chloroflexi bacterium]|nr:M23 family metallopeptidase [Chloroflexota bacterium]